MALTEQTDCLYQAPNGKMLYCSGFKITWLSELGIQPKVIIDAGSFDGGDACRFRKAFPQAEIIAIEADPRRFVIMKENVTKQHIIAECCALTDHSGIVDWYRSTARGEASASGSMYMMNQKTRSRHKQTALPASVPSDRLENLCISHGIAQIDLLHMDIEGATLPALRGLGSIRPKLIFTEMADCWDDAPSPSDAHAWLTREGYVISRSLQNDRLYRRE